MKKRKQVPRAGAAAKIPPPGGASPCTGAVDSQTHYAPLTARLHIAFIPPDVSDSERVRIVTAHTDSFVELRRRERELAKPVEEHIRRVIFNSSSDTQGVAECIELMKTHYIERERIQDVLDSKVQELLREFSERNGGAVSKDLAAACDKATRRIKRRDAEAELFNAVQMLYESVVNDKDSAAAAALADHLMFGVQLLYTASALHPDLFRQYASEQVLWPVLANHRGKVSPGPVTVLASIGLASNTLKARMKDAQGGCEAREWAQAILETLEHNRDAMKKLTVYQPTKERLEKLAAVTFLPVPDWARQCAELPPFAPDKPTLDAWKKTGAAMLKAECGDFHKHAGWDIFKKRWELNDMSEADQAARILDGIKKAMNTLAGARAYKRAA